MLEDLRRPNASLGYKRPRPILERDPLNFWRAVAIGLLLVNMALIFLLSR